jgi:hypothetical protein
MNSIHGFRNGAALSSVWTAMAPNSRFNGTRHRNNNIMNKDGTTFAPISLILSVLYLGGRVCVLVTESKFENGAIADYKHENARRVT